MALVSMITTSISTATQVNTRLSKPMALKSVLNVILYALNALEAHPHNVCHAGLAMSFRMVTVWVAVWIPINTTAQALPRVKNAPTSV